MRRALLIDGGQSGCRAALLHDGETVATATGPGLARHGRDYGVLRALALGEFDVVAAGLTGFTGEAEAVAAALDAPRALVTDDAVTTHLGALGGAPGIVVAAGTGAIALAAGADGTVARAGGWGPLLGDDGGGYWIGRAGLASALRARDGRGGSLDLLARAEARFGAGIVAGHDGGSSRAAVDEPPGGGIVAAVYDAPDPVAVVASFAREVADAARAGDEAAAEIFAQAGRELARSALAAGRHAGVDGPVAFAGGLFAAGELLLASFRAELSGDVRPPLGTSLDGAARLLERPPLFAHLIHETGAP
jgi:N-acetylmuramic acid 6-phosphate etherase